MAVVTAIRPCRPPHLSRTSEPHVLLRNTLLLLPRSIDQRPKAPVLKVIPLNVRSGHEVRLPGPIVSDAVFPATHLRVFPRLIVPQVRHPLVVEQALATAQVLVGNQADHPADAVEILDYERVACAAIPALLEIRGVSASQGLLSSAVPDAGSVGDRHWIGV